MKSLVFDKDIETMIGSRLKGAALKTDAHTARITLWSWKTLNTCGLLTKMASLSTPSKSIAETQKKRW